MADPGLRRGRPRRADVERQVGATALEVAAEVGYAGATLDRIAEGARVAKTTLYRRWSTKENLFVDAVAARLGSPDLEPSDGPGMVARKHIEWIVTRLSLPGMGAALAGVYVEAHGDRDLRERLFDAVRAPYLESLVERLHIDESTVDLLVDMVVGATVIHHGTTGRGYTAEEAVELTDLILRAAAI